MAGSKMMSITKQAVNVGTIEQMPAGPLRSSTAATPVRQSYFDTHVAEKLDPSDESADGTDSVAPVRLTMVIW